MRKLFMLFIAILTASLVFAQKIGPIKPLNIKPKIKTYWQTYIDSASVSEEEGINLLAQPLTVKNEKGAIVKLVRYTFLYKRVGIAEDEETGKKRPSTTIVSKDFDKTPLSELWQQSIASQLHSGEELQFFNVVVKDEKGRMTLASNLTIKIK